MNSLRTDLAIERHQSLNKNIPDGVLFQKETHEGVVLTKITVQTESAASAIKKPVGVYYTAEINGFPDVSSIIDETLDVIVKSLSELLPEKGSVLVAGLGNANITPDALGPKCADMVFATRHINKKTFTDYDFPELREVCVIAPGVTGQTGFESVEIIASLCEKTHPCAVIAVDALAAADVERLNRTIQISSAGIEPGSGVKNSRKALNKDSLGIPVIAVGVPTVVDAVSLAKGIFEGAGEKTESDFADMMVTSRDIDTVIENASRLLALSINCALQKNMGPEELLSLM